MKKDPFRPAENWTKCPACGTDYGWNKEDGLVGQTCPCGYTFRPGRRPKTAKMEEAK